MTDIVRMLRVFAVAAVVVPIGWALVGDDPLLRQAVVWVANVLMLTVIWLDLRQRGQGWRDLGLRAPAPNLRSVVVTLLASFLVAVLALVGFVAGSMLMQAVTPAAPATNTGGYSYLHGNLPLLLVALPAVYLVSSFGEEVLYRGFLIARTEDAAGGRRGATSLAVVVSAVVFGLAHFDWGIGGVVQTAVMGLVLALAYTVGRRNLTILVLAHAWIDTLLLVQMYA